MISECFKCVVHFSDPVVFEVIMISILITNFETSGRRWLIISGVEVGLQ